MKFSNKFLPFSLAFYCLACPIHGAILQLGESSTLHLLADAEYVYTDNLFLRTEDSTSGSYFVFSPGIEWRISQTGGLALTLQLVNQFEVHDERPELDDDFIKVTGNFRYDTGRFLWSGNLAYAEYASNTVDARLEDSLIRREHIDAGLKAKYEISELTAVEAGFQFSEVDYESSIFTDHDDLTIPVTFYYSVRPKIDLTAGIQFRSVETSTSVDFDASEYDDTYYFVGAVGEFFSPLIFADFKVGYQEREFDRSRYGASSTSSASYDITFIYTGDVKTTVYAGISRDYRSSAIGGDSYISTSGTLGVRYSLNEVLFMMDLGVFVAFEDWGYYGTAFKINFRF